MALPLAVPAIAVGLVLNVFLQWSEVLLGLIMLPSGEATTAMTAIASFSTQFRVSRSPPLRPHHRGAAHLPAVPARPAMAAHRDLR
ncbi:MAG: hypothetical protein R3C32_06625 [Chloroflexota bacterium]